MPDLIKLTIRLPKTIHELLREASFKARITESQLIRDAMIEMLAKNKIPTLPDAAPPAIDELSTESKNLLSILQASISNLSQLCVHASEIGDPISRLSAPGGLLINLSDKCKSLGIEIKSGAIAHALAAQRLNKLSGSAKKLNGLAHALNVDRNTVSGIDWHSTLTDFRNSIK